MSNCTCNQSNAAPVPDYSSHGFNAGDAPGATVRLSADVLALKLSACVQASYDPSTNQICFQVPIYGNYCISSPIPIPVGGQLKACVETCGSIIPSGLKVTIYVNGSAVFTRTLWGSC
jgi:hypothetical protein